MVGSQFSVPRGSLGVDIGLGSEMHNFGSQLLRNNCSGSCVPCSMMKSIFVGPQGIRAGWRFLLFVLGGSLLVVGWIG